MIRHLIFAFVLIFSFSIKAQNANIVLIPDQNFPKWLKVNQNGTDQTSGIAFIKSACNKKYFLTADDIGFINLLTISCDTIFSIEQISFIDSAENYFDTFPKKDFEEISYDKNSGYVYLSVEGNGENYNDFVGIYRLIFEENDIFSKRIVSVTKMSFTPTNLFYQYTNWNIGYEGFALDDNYFYLGLEGFLKNYQFADSTLIYIADKSNLNIIKEISTKRLGIYTVCGLFSDDDYSLWGIDRNNRTIFHINFDEEFNIKDFSKFDGVTFIPGYHNLNFLPSYESITMDNEKNIYIVDDPWKEVFIPKEDILDKLDEETITNFKTYVPTIFKFKVTYP
jgi:hypothetical protein